MKIFSKFSGEVSTKDLHEALCKSNYISMQSVFSDEAMSDGSCKIIFNDINSKEFDVLILFEDMISGRRHLAIKHVEERLCKVTFVGQKKDW